MGDVTPAIPFPVIERRLAAARQQKEVSGEGDSHQQDISLCSVVRRWLTSQGGEVRSAGLSGGIAGGVENEVVREVRVKCKGSMGTKFRLWQRQTTPLLLADPIAMASRWH